MLGLSGLGFVSLGLPDGLLGVAWPSMRAFFGVPLDALGMLLVATTGGYVVSSFLSGWMLARSTIGGLLAASCLATAASLLGYAAAPAWAVVVALGVLAGLGAGAIDAGINTYVATHHSTRTLGLMHACYGLGTATGPIVMTALLGAGLGWQSGYLLVGAAQVALASCFGMTRRSWRAGEGSGAAAAPAAPITETLRLPASRLGIVAFLLYVGLEATSGVWIYSLLHDGRGASMVLAGAAVSIYWGGLMTGRLLLALLAPADGPEELLRPCIATLTAAAAVLVADAGTVTNVVAVLLLGVAAGPIFPALVATTPRRLAARHTANAVGFQVAAAAVGQSLLPAAVGVAAAAAGLEIMPIVLLGTGLLLLATHAMLERVAPVLVD